MRQATQHTAEKVCSRPGFLVINVVNGILNEVFSLLQYNPEALVSVQHSVGCHRWADYILERFGSISVKTQQYLYVI